MNKELASVLKDRIANLPFVDVLAGMVQTVEDSEPLEDGGAKVRKFPMSTDIVLDPTCYTGKERILIPDSSKKSIIYFEDFGSSVLRGGRNKDVEISSRIRLVAWLNRDRLVGDSYAFISGFCMAAICGRLDLKFVNAGIFKRLTVRPTGFPQQDAGLFARYTYDQTERQYLMPPFEVFGIDFTCTAMVNAGCIAEIDFTNSNNC